MKRHTITLTFLSLLAVSASCFAQSYGGYPDIPANGVAFASESVLYEPGAGVGAPQDDPTRALGEPDQKTTSLGRLGSLVLSSGDYQFHADGTDEADFYIYEHLQVESWDTYVSTDSNTWLKVEPTFNVKNGVGSVNGYDLDALGSMGSQYQYVKVVDTSNSSGTTSSGSDIDGVVFVSAKYSGASQVVDTDSRNGIVYNLEKHEVTGVIDVKIIDKLGTVEYVPFSSDDSLEPISLSVQGNYDCDDEKDINVLVTRKSDGVQLNIIKNQRGDEIRTIDNSVTN